MKSPILSVIQIFVVLQCLITTSLGDTTGRTRPEVKVANGFVWGTIVTAPNGKEVYAFYGIPFAKPPLGELRFKRPVPLTEKWSVPFDASKLPNACPQVNIESFPNFTGERVWNPNSKVSEDCLYLNVWVPASVFKKKSNVLFWIYGGGFYSGSSSLDVYNGATLASEEDVVVVSTQYRLGAQGFLYFGTEDAPGNMGLIDQNLALKWVNDNIQAFGGDPADVTLFGESAGSASVSYHLLSPLSQNLFKRAVLLSGVATAPWAFRTAAEAAENSYRIAKYAGCPSEAGVKDPTQVLECLKQVDADMLIKALWMHPRKILELPITPTIDGYFLPDTPEELIKNWDTKRSEIIIGNTADEGTYFLPYKYKKYFHHLKSPSISYDGYLSIMREIFQDWPTAEKDAILFHYTNWVNREDGVVNAKNIADAVGEAFFVCPLRDFADQWSGRGLNVYFYFFTEHTDSDPWGRWMGVKHGDEIDYFFGKPNNASTQQFTAKEQELSKKIMTLLSTFAKTGRASRKWERYTRDYPIYLDLNGTVISDETQESVHGPRAEACAFWNIYLPQLRKTLELENGNIIEKNVDSGNCNRILDSGRGRRTTGQQEPEPKGNQIEHECCDCCAK